MLAVVQDRMSSEFARLDLSRWDDTPTVLFDGPEQLVVLMDERGRPVGLLTGAEASDAATNPDRQVSHLLRYLAPIVVVRPTASLRHLMRSAASTALSLGARGAVVMDEGELLGVITAAALAGYLTDEYQRELRLMGTSPLGGDIVTPLLIMHCKRYGHRNELTFYDRHKPPNCQVEQPAVHVIDAP